MKSNFNNVLILIIILLILTFFQLSLKEPYENYGEDQEDDEESIDTYDTSFTCPEEQEDCVFASSIPTRSNEVIYVDDKNPEYINEQSNQQANQQSNNSYIQPLFHENKGNDLNNSLEKTIVNVKSRENEIDRSKKVVEADEQQLKNTKSKITKKINNLLPKLQEFKSTLDNK